MNELKQEKSPYLLQHAANPVHWRAWSAQTLETARARGLPLFVSIGYSTCHWCHVMERESFESQKIADFLNENFTCIKIDREEHPDIDSIYMSAVQLMTGRGGWPLNVFLDADLKPFFGGTYFRAPQFLQLITSISEAWTGQKETLVAQGDEILKHLHAMREEALRGTELKELPIEKYLEIFDSHYDAKNGGKMGAPKFPLSYDLFLLSQLNRPTHNFKIRHTIDRMSRSGVYDQLEGGLHRYSTDDEWKVPHFEKMLYDQSAFVEACLADFEINGNSESLEIAARTVDYVLNRLQTPDGAFYSAEDADSEGEEGKFYRWDEREIRTALGDETASKFIATLDWPPGGNFEGHYVIHLKPEISLSEWHRAFAREIAILRELRAERPRPITDTKVLTSWNGLFVAALSKFVQVSGTLEQKYWTALDAALTFADKNLLNSNGEVYRRHADGESKYRGALPDYAFWISGLLAAFSLRPSAKLQQQIETLMQKQEDLFSDAETGLYWNTPSDENGILLREVETYDNVEPSGNSVALKNLVAWYALSGDEKVRARLERFLNAMPAIARDRPHGFPVLLSAALQNQVGLATYFVVSKDATWRAQTIRSLFAKTQEPKLVVQVDPLNADLQKIAWLKDKITEGQNSAIYRCQNQTCDPPCLLSAALTARHLLQK